MDDLDAYNIEACRTCGIYFTCDETTLRPLFTSTCGTDAAAVMGEIMQQLLEWTIEINPDDGLSQYMCLGCIHEFTKISKFKTSCIQTQEQFTTSINNNNNNNIVIKSEITEDNPPYSSFIYVDTDDEEEEDGSTRVWAPFDIPHVPIKEEHMARVPQESSVTAPLTTQPIETEIKSDVQQDVNCDLEIAQNEISATSPPGSPIFEISDEEVEAEVLKFTYDDEPNATPPPSPSAPSSVPTPPATTPSPRAVLPVSTPCPSVALPVPTPCPSMALPVPTPCPSAAVLAPSTSTPLAPAPTPSTSTPLAPAPTPSTSTQLAPTPTPFPSAAPPAIQQIKVKCSLCSMESDTQELHMQHMKRVHTLKNCTCHICGKKFNHASEARFKFHMKWHNLRKHKNCPICGFLCDSNDTLREHKNAVHSRVQCKYCNKKMKPRALKSHLETHLQQAEIEAEKNQLINGNDNLLPNGSALETVDNFAMEIEECSEVQQPQIVLPIQEAEEAFMIQPTIQNEISLQVDPLPPPPPTFAKPISHSDSLESLPHKVMSKCDICDKEFDLKIKLNRHLKQHKRDGLRSSGGSAGVPHDD